MIVTNRIKLTYKNLFLILITRYIKKRWWLLIWIWVLATILALQENYTSFEYFFMLLAIIYPLALVIQFWMYVKSNDNKLLLTERHYEIDSEKIVGIIDSDTYSPIKLEHFIKVDKIRETYLLYISKNQFIYIPGSSFKNDSEKEWFETEIIKKIANKK
uniref:YcxB family protein n=1 Tax=uncultured Draconibacterium sp. TaxID=1573823 RepID=UPI003216FC48